MRPLGTISAALAEADTQRWLERAVVGLNLCPFAKAVHVRGQIHYASYLAVDASELLDALLIEAHALMASTPANRDTTLLIAPNTLSDFLDFNHFVTRAERHLVRSGFDGRLQLASFHPLFQFAGTDAEDLANSTNRSPYPTLHLLREDSVSRAVDAFPDAEAIFGRNISILESLGSAGWTALDVGPGGSTR